MLICEQSERNFEHSLEFNGKWLDWKKEYATPQRWKNKTISIFTFADKVDQPIALRFAVGSKMKDRIQYAEIYVAITNKPTLFIFSAEEMESNTKIDLNSIVEIYFGGKPEIQCKVYYNISIEDSDKDNCFPKFEFSYKGNKEGSFQLGVNNSEAIKIINKRKIDSAKSIHRTRELELKKIFGKCCEDMFENALELGGGDGYQSHRISKFCKKYICTDINKAILLCNDDKVQYRVADAEKLLEYFAPNSFDFVYASSLLEHLPHVDTALKSIYDILTDDGIFICLLPNQLWKILNVVCYPILRYFQNKECKQMKNRGVLMSSYDEYNNNVKKKVSVHKRKSIPIHGISETNVEEFFAFSKRAWVKKFLDNGFVIKKFTRGPVSSGWGIGHPMVKRFMEGIHLGSVNIYVLAKNSNSKNFEM